MTLTASSRGCSGVGCGVGTNGGSGPFSPRRQDQDERRKDEAQRGDLGAGAAGQQGQVLSTGVSICSFLAGAQAASRRAATVGARSPAVLYRALPTTHVSAALVRGADRLEIHAAVNADLEVQPAPFDLVAELGASGSVSCRNACPPQPGCTVTEQQVDHGRATA